MSSSPDKDLHWASLIPFKILNSDDSERGWNWVFSQVSIWKAIACEYLVVKIAWATLYLSLLSNLIFVTPYATSCSRLLQNKKSKKWSHLLISNFRRLFFSHRNHKSFSKTFISFLCQPYIYYIQIFCTKHFCETSDGQPLIKSQVFPEHHFYDTYQQISKFPHGYLFGSQIKSWLVAKHQWYFFLDLDN